jgi:UDP-N-acetylmuramate dehydrogenase
LTEAVAPGIALDADLQGLNTLGLPARAARLTRVSAPEQVVELMRQSGWGESPRLVLGSGSNVVLTHDFPGLVLKVEISGRALVGEDEHAWYVRAGAGVCWHDFVCWTVAQGWPGLENLALIPGTVGAAPIQNIGAYGLELEQRFDRLEAVSLDDGSVRHFDRDACAFGYRDSVFKQAEAGRWLIASVTLRLPKRWQPVVGYADVASELADGGVNDPAPVDVLRAVVDVRRRKLPDPALLGNAGSFFKNPLVDAATLEHILTQQPDLPHYPQADGQHKLAAGWLIERAGWKGRTLGPVGCYARQALVLVNHGGATGADVQRVAAAIQRDVAAKFSVHLEPEPVFI